MPTRNQSCRGFHQWSLTPKARLVDNIYVQRMRGDAKAGITVVKVAPMNSSRKGYGYFVEITDGNVRKKQHLHIPAPSILRNSIMQSGFLLPCSRRLQQGAESNVEDSCDLLCFRWSVQAGEVRASRLLMRNFFEFRRNRTSRARK